MFELEQILRSKQETLTLQELNVLQTCKSKAMKDFVVGASVPFVVVWKASQRLNNFFRINLSGGAAAISGMWAFGRSLESCIDHILALDGSRLQRELAILIMRRYQNDPWSMRLISKHFYSERVFDDLAPEQPKIRWRYRNFFDDNVALRQRTQESESYGDTDSKMNDLEPKQLPIMNKSVDVMADPLDCVFGYSGMYEEIHHPVNSNTSPRTLTRAYKKSHRRHRLRHQEVSSNSQTP